ncbi:PspC domain-containing protein [Sphingorhabdus arenilitoris]|uniref:PspC domain-containing protein n=1 Tax=Sphingorhabdus arenilitoris TaxID=1490041 RepID=A0ABV8RDE2_9SPHN
MNKLTLDKQNKKIWGVCSGLANWANIDTSLVRLGFVIATLIGVGSPILIYLVLGLILD